jgi:hypothetical protein
MDRRKKIERILALQGTIHRLAEWQLAALDRKQTELVADRGALFEALNADVPPLHGLFVEAMARRLTALAREEDRLGRAREAQQRRLVEEGLRLKRFERVNGRAQRDAAAAARKRGFEALLDALASTDDASLP